MTPPDATVTSPVTVSDPPRVPATPVAPDTPPDPFRIWPAATVRPLAAARIPSTVVVGPRSAAFPSTTVRVPPETARVLVNFTFPVPAEATRSPVAVSGYGTVSPLASNRVSPLRVRPAPPEAVNRVLAPDPATVTVPDPGPATLTASVTEIGLPRLIVPVTPAANPMVSGPGAALASAIACRRL